LCGDPVRCSRMGLAGREWALDAATMAVMAARYAVTYGPKEPT